jgi:formylglycine-generating enzyme required for sulfatase activity
MKILFQTLLLFCSLGSMYADPPCCCSKLPPRYSQTAPKGMVWIPGGTFTMGTDKPLCDVAAKTMIAIVD